MRQEAAKEKTGVELKGVKAVNPATKEEISVWIADYVLGTYGTGAIMAVPAHDERDFEFAKKFGLPVKQVVCGNYPEPVCPVLDAAYVGAGRLVGSGKFDGMDSEEAKKAVTESVGGETKTQYKLRDWSVSRQRYWGAPIPMINCGKCGIVPVPDDELPVLLPELENYRPHGMPPLAGSKEFVDVTCPKCGGEAARDPETLDTFVDSSWYYLRYADPHDDKAIFDKGKAAHWMPVDLYVIGAEHTVLHLLYSRFMTKFLHDEGLLPFEEPFAKLRHVGLILGADGAKMSKSKGNVVNPDDLVKEFGADVVRLYLMFMGPFEDAHPWEPKGISGVERFLARAWKWGEAAAADRATADRVAAKEESGPSKNPLVHRTVKKVGEDIEQLKFNTAISALMILLGELEKAGRAEYGAFEAFVKILYPFAPHAAQELWSLAGHGTFLDREPWPAYDPALVREDKITLVLQVNGKVRATAEADAGIGEDDAKALALGDTKVRNALGGKEPKKAIYVPGKLVNIVV